MSPITSLKAYFILKILDWNDVILNKFITNMSTEKNSKNMKIKFATTKVIRVTQTLKLVYTSTG